MGPVLIIGADGIADQQGAKSGTIDEKIAGDGRPALQCQRSNISAVTIEIIAGHLSLDPLDAPGLGIATQEERIARRIKMVGIDDPRQR